MTTDFQCTIKRLEDSLAGGKWDRAELELKNAYVLQPSNRYLDAYAQRLDSLRGSSEVAHTLLRM